MSSPVLPRLGIFTESSLARTHGTGAQLLRLFDVEGVGFFHIYFNEANEGKSEVANSWLISDPMWPWRTGAAFFTRTRAKLGISKWIDGSINRTWFANFIKSHGLTSEVNYVVPANEAHAGQINSMLAFFPGPYVVHIMDIYAIDGLDPTTMPQMKKLLESAAFVIAITPPILAEVQKFKIPAERVALIPVGQAVTDAIAKPPASGDPIRMVMVGRPYEKGCELLDRSYLSLVESIPRIRLLYAGFHFHQLPPRLQAVTENVGLIKDKTKYAEFLAGCHLAYLSGPADLDHLGKFSFPSRSTDYLMAGLPIIGCIAAGSATEATFAPITPVSVKVVATREEVVAGATELGLDADRWLRASAAARNFAVENLSIEIVKSKIHDILRRVNVAG